jgi:hypothetical protein
MAADGSVKHCMLPQPVIIDREFATIWYVMHSLLPSKLYLLVDVISHPKVRAKMMLFVLFRVLAVKITHTMLITHRRCTGRDAQVPARIPGLIQEEGCYPILC